MWNGENKLCLITCVLVLWLSSWSTIFLIYVILVNIMEAGAPWFSTRQLWNVKRKNILYLPKFSLGEMSCFNRPLTSHLHFAFEPLKHFRFDQNLQLRVWLKDVWYTLRRHVIHMFDPLVFFMWWVIWWKIVSDRPSWVFQINLQILFWLLGFHLNCTIMKQDLVHLL